ncbi:endoplasmic reticulum junction formation protein lunapark-B [Anastrepha ludens]|uniref:endoplasmic reticulum junction formation protein lunapark-B n=1 Tax=Anastrepha ludens TaxID=28586 RepID=UPI0023AF1469|nr:endoplasmic reticulum junction formation protein lunapark-B [Anastrepha ludens]
MGAILAKFRKEKSTDEVLEGLEEKIKQIEKYTLNTKEQKRRIVGNFLATSIGIYVIAFIVFYFVYFPPTWRERIIYSVPLFLFPFVIIFLRRLFTWYFERKLNKNSNKLTALHEEKKKILEQVMDKETYKVAVKLLARYGSQKSVNVLTPRVPPAGNLNIATQRLAIAPSPNAPANVSSLQDLRLRAPLSTTSLSLTPRQRISSSPAATGVPAPTGQALIPRAPLAITPQRRPVGGALAGQELRRRTPFPVVNQQAKGVLERIVDVLIGDGPKDRFAMICKECYSHNGMALREDFDYTTFRCAFCNALNPARKARPIAPRLPEQHFLHQKRGSNSSSSSPTDIDSENDEPVDPMSTTGSAAVTPRIQLTEATNTPVKTAAAAFDKLNALGVMQRQPEIGGGDAPGAMSENAADAAGNEEEQQLEREKAEEQQQETVTAKVVANLQALHATEDDELSRLQERFAQMYAMDDVGAEQQQLRAVETDADKQLRELEQAEQLDELKKSK